MHTVNWGDVSTLDAILYWIRVNVSPVATILLFPTVYLRIALHFYRDEEN